MPMPERQPDARDFASRVRQALGLTALAAAGGVVLALHPYVPLAAFASILGALALDGAAAPLRRRLHLPTPLAVCTIAGLALSALVVAGWASGPRVVEQGALMMERLPEALNRLERSLAGTAWGQLLVSTAGDWDAQRLRGALAGAWQPLAGIFATALAALSGAGVVAVLALFLALAPQVYVGGLLRLARPERRSHHAEVLRAMARALRWWLVGRLASMLAVGLLTGLGLALLGAPVATFLGVLAGLLTFVPYLGPLLAAIPAVLLGLAEGIELALAIAALYTGVQLLENNLLTPVLQARTVSLPPAVLILAQLLMGGLFGLLGILVATPLSVVAIVAVQMLYVRDVLGEPVVPMGERGGPREAGAARGERAQRSRARRSRPGVSS